MEPAAFRALLTDAGLRQNQLARLLGKSVATVNRWCVDGDRADHLAAPRYAVAFLVAFTALPAKLRAAVLARLQEPDETKGS